MQVYGERWLTLRTALLQATNHAALMNPRVPAQSIARE